MQYVVDASAVLPHPSLLTQYVVYDHPRDFPAHIVVRIWDVDGVRPVQREVAALFEDLDKARAWCQQRGCICIGRQDDDDAKIVEVWM